MQGNRPADEMVTEDQSMCRRVRLTVGLGPSAHDNSPRGLMYGVMVEAAIGLLAQSAMGELEARQRNHTQCLEGARPDRGRRQKV